MLLPNFPGFNELFNVERFSCATPKRTFLSGSRGRWGDRKVDGSTRLTFVFGELRCTGKFLCRSDQKRGRMKCYKRGRGTSIQEQSQCSRFHLDVVDMDVDVVVAVAVTVHEKVLWMWPSLYRAVSDSLAC